MPGPEAVSTVPQEEVDPVNKDGFPVDNTDDPNLPDCPYEEDGFVTYGIP